MSWGFFSGVTGVGIKREGFFVSMALTGLACVMTVWEERQTDRFE